MRLGVYHLCIIRNTHANLRPQPPNNSIHLVLLNALFILSKCLRVGAVTPVSLM